MKKVKEHFEEEAAEFDKLILKLIPHYEEMITALISSIPHDKRDSIKVMDLGCGTGTITKSLKDKFKNANVTCLDLAQNMIKMAKLKLNRYYNINYITGDFYHFNFPEKYDVILSSLALHHLVTDEDKKQFYTRIYEALNPGGVFLNADVVLGSNEYLQKLYLEKWKEFMNKSVSMKEIEEKWIPAAEEEDHPAILIDQLGWLREIGFKDVVSLLKSTESDGKVHTVWTFKSPYIGAICNCDERECLFFHLKNRYKFAKIIMKGHEAAIINSEICIRCGKCKKICQFNAVLRYNEKVIINENCYGCGVCRMHCPVEAIRLLPKKSSLKYNKK